MATETEKEDGQDIEFELPTEVAEEPEFEVAKPAEEPKPAAPSIDDGIEEIRRKLDEERRDRELEKSRREAAERRAHEADERAVAAQTETQTANLGLIKSALEQRQQARETLKARKIEAKQAGDFAAEADLDDELANIVADIRELERGKQMLETAPKPQPTRPQVDSDPVNALSSEMERGGFKRSAEWVRTHPEFVRDPKQYQRMLAAHNLAVADGIAPDTDEYFDSVESTLRIKKAAEPAAKVEIPVRESPPPSAPASRQGGTVGASTTKSVRLTAAEVEMAENMGMTPKEYAQNKYMAQKEGRFNR